MGGLLSTLFGGGIEGIGGLVTEIKDDNLKRQVIQVGIGAGYSQYITGLYTLGKQLEGKKWIGIFADPLKKMAAAQYRLLIFQSTEKIIDLAVPQDLVKDQALLDSIYVEEKKEK